MADGEYNTYKYIHRVCVTYHSLLPVPRNISTFCPRLMHPVCLLNEGDTHVSKRAAISWFQTPPYPRWRYHFTTRPPEIEIDSNRMRMYSSCKYTAHPFHFAEWIMSKIASNTHSIREYVSCNRHLSSIVYIIIAYIVLYSIDSRFLHKLNFGGKCEN